MIRCTLQFDDSVYSYLVKQAGHRGISQYLENLVRNEQREELSIKSMFERLVSMNQSISRHQDKVLDAIATIENQLTRIEGDTNNGDID